MFLLYFMIIHFLLTYSDSLSDIQNRQKTKNLECFSQTHLCINITHYKICKEKEPSYKYQESISCPTFQCCQPGRDVPCTGDCPKFFYQQKLYKQPEQEVKLRSSFDDLTKPANSVMTIKTLVVHKTDVEDFQKSDIWTPSYKRNCCPDFVTARVLSSESYLDEGIHRAKRSLETKNRKACPGGKIRHRYPLNCQYYYQCVRSHGSYQLILKQCPNDLYFDTETLTCTYEFEIICILDSPALRALAEEAEIEEVPVYNCTRHLQLISDVHNCSNYFMCLSTKLINRFELRHYSCNNPFLYFDYKSLTCTPNNCSNNQSIINYNKTSFRRCHCKSDAIITPVTFQIPYDLNKTILTTDILTTTSSYEIEQENNGEPNVSHCFKNNVTKLVHAFSCFGYYLCLNEENGINLTLQYCSDGRAFDFDEQKCRPESKVNCSKFHQEGPTLKRGTLNKCGVVAKIKSISCKEYYECRSRNRDFNYLLKKYCPQGKLFDFYRQKCRPKEEVECFDEDYENDYD